MLRCHGKHVHDGDCVSFRYIWGKNFLFKFKVKYIYTEYVSITVLTYHIYTNTIPYNSYNRIHMYDIYSFIANNALQWHSKHASESAILSFDGREFHASGH